MSLFQHECWRLLAHSAAGGGETSSLCGCCDVCRKCCDMCRLFYLVAAAQVVTSTSLGAQEVLTIVGSTRAPQDDSPAKFAIDVPKMRAAFTGTGDLMAALLLAHLNRAPKRVAHAVEQTVASVQAVLCNTLEHAGDEAGDGAEGAAGMREKELRLIQSSDELLQADVTCRARDLT